MEQLSDEREQQIKQNYQPDPKLLTCDICSMIFDRPTTLACGHTFCHQCLISSISKKNAENKQNRAITMIPLCPRCQAIIWRPLGTLKENVTLSAIISRFALKTKQQSTPVSIPPHCEAQFHIMIECASNSNTLLPHCYTQVVFATAFIDEILEQQSQSNFVVLKWPGADQNIGIAGRLLRPQTYHYLMKASRYETVYKAIFQGKYFVNILDWQELDLKVSSTNNYYQTHNMTCSLKLCQVQQLNAKNPLSLQRFRMFFEIYDKLNNPIYLRQIAQLVDERILHERNSPSDIIYCIMRILKINDRQLSSIAKNMDDEQRWLQIEQFLVKNAHKEPAQIIKINIPGRQSQALIFAIIFLLLLFHFLAK